MPATSDRENDPFLSWTTQQVDHWTTKDQLPGSIGIEPSPQQKATRVAGPRSNFGSLRLTTLRTYGCRRQAHVSGL
ncbi:uncharacterized protein BDW70DRAFT_129900 [Aspergillus foveolatus]|uniref:uncharacterized protein n=1 Tax=Aspergillus foveolatus TaxID=210207 RepID=UPI003CCDFBCE